MCIYLAEGKSINHETVQISWWQSSREYPKKILKEKLPGDAACCAERFLDFKRHTKSITNKKCLWNGNRYPLCYKVLSQSWHCNPKILALVAIFAIHWILTVHGVYI